MNVDKLCHYGSRTFFYAALILFAAAIVVKVLGMLKMIPMMGYNAGRLVEFSAMFLVPVITVLLRQIREELRKGRPA